MDHNYNDTPLLTSSEMKTIIEDLKPETFSDFGSPFHLEQNTYEDEIISPMLRTPVEEYTVQGQRESMHVTPPHLPPSISPTGTIPSRDEYPGFLKFEMFLDSTTSNRKSWLYSNILNKVFIDMNKSLLIQFRVNHFANGLYVRALPVYEQDDFVSVPVTRCGMHALNDDPHFKAHPKSQPGVCFCARHNMVRHVVLCSHPHAKYDYNSESERHSVVVPLHAPQSGSDTTTVEYHFGCKTSCPHGMNRKPIVVIFTLENEQCEVLGRLVLPVKICSCPKRDKDKEEKEFAEAKDQDPTGNGGSGLPKNGKRRLSAHDKQELKRIKTENPQVNETIQEQPSDLIKRLDNMETKLNQLQEHLQKIERNQHQIEQKLNQFFDCILSKMQ